MDATGRRWLEGYSVDMVLLIIGRVPPDLRDDPLRYPNFITRSMKRFFWAWRSRIIWRR